MKKLFITLFLFILSFNIFCCNGTLGPSFTFIYDEIIFNGYTYFYQNYGLSISSSLKLTEILNSFGLYLDVNILVVPALMNIESSDSLINMINGAASGIYSLKLVYDFEIKKSLFISPSFGFGFLQMELFRDYSVMLKHPPIFYSFSLSAGVDFEYWFNKIIFIRLINVFSINLFKRNWDIADHFGNKYNVIGNKILGFTTGILFGFGE